MSISDKAVYRPKGWISAISILLTIIFILCGIIPLKMSFDYRFDFMLFFMGSMSLTAGLIFFIAITKNNRKITLSENGIIFGRKKFGWNNTTVLGRGKENIKYKVYFVTVGSQSNEYLSILARYSNNKESKFRRFKIYQRSYRNYYEICERIQDCVKKHRQGTEFCG